VATLLGTELDRTLGSNEQGAKTDESPVRVLVVMYDTWLRWQLSFALGTAGCEVVQASNGASGLRLADRHNLDLILVAPRLPELSGAPLLEAFREMPGSRHVPIAIVERVEWSPLHEEDHQPSLELDGQWIINHCLPPQSRAVPSVDAAQRGEQPARVRRSRRTLSRAVSSSPPSEPDAVTPEELHVVQARPG
jgi:DNA-binding NarL/FixJ family response regulator